jgi:hypothetical protein
MSIPGLEVDSLTRENPKKPRNAELIKKQIEFEWMMNTQQGNISFTSVGFSQYVRSIKRAPKGSIKAPLSSTPL